MSGGLGFVERDVGQLVAAYPVVVLMRPVEVSELLGVPVGTLANWRCAGVGPPFLRVGRHVRYRVADVEAWVAARVRDPGAVVADR